MQVELYTWTFCPFCIRAKQLLESKGVAYTEHVMDERSAELNELKRKFGHSTVPIILIDGEFIGGNDDLHALAAEGRFD
jgi:glutaredoxin 3